MKKPLFKRKFFLRLFSLFAGVFIWMYVVSSAEIEVNLKAPLKIAIPKGLAISNEFVRVIEYRFKGPGLLVRKLLDREIKIDIKEEEYYKKGKYNYHINIENYNFKLPISVEQISVTPRELNLKLERIMHKTIRVKPNFAANILENFDVKDVKVFPDKVKISGPRSLIKKMNFVETKLIEDINLVSEGGFLTEINIHDPRLQLDEKNVNLSYSLHSKNVSKTFRGIPIVFQSISLVKRAFPKEVVIKISGEEKKINSLRQEDIHVLAMIPKKNRSKQEIELITELPEGIKLVEINPSKVSVELE